MLTQHEGIERETWASVRAAYDADRHGTGQRGRHRNGKRVLDVMMKTAICLNEVRLL